MTPYVGEIRIFGGNYAPAGWLLCQGQLVPVTSYELLYNIIGTTYGGDGATSFGIPDLAGRTPTGPLGGQPLGTMGGSETVALTVAQMPGHTHQARASDSSARPSPKGAVWGANPSFEYTVAVPDVLMADDALGLTGTGEAHDNMAPFLGLNFIIATSGRIPVEE